MLFNTYHLAYIAISAAVTAGLLLLFSRIRRPETKSLILKVSGIVTIVIHNSSVWVEFLITGKAEAYGVILFPIFFCNFCMYLLFICGLIKTRKAQDSAGSPLLLHTAARSAPSYPYSIPISIWRSPIFGIGESSKVF